MISRASLPLLTLVVLMLAGCGGESGYETSGASEEISTAFTEVILENLSASTDDVTPGLSASHGRYFEHLGHLAFEDSVILGYLSHVRAREDGTFLIVDMPGRSAHLFSASGELVRTLDPTECDPGVNWMPRGGAFLSDGHIVVTNNDARSTVRFTADGVCDRFVEPQGSVADDVAPLADGSFLTHEESFEEHWLAERDPDGNEIRTFGHSSEFVNLNYRMGASNFLVAYPDGRVLIGLPHASAPTLYRSGGTAGSPLYDPPAYVRPLDEDIRDTRGMSQDEMISEMRGFFSGYTLITSIFALSDESLMVVYRNGFRDAEDEDFFGVHVSDLEGRPLTPDAVTFAGQIEGSDSRFLPYFAKDNLVFTTRPAEELPGGDWGNPGLDVWRFRSAADGG